MFHNSECCPEGRLRTGCSPNWFSIRDWCGTMKGPSAMRQVGLSVPSLSSSSPDWPDFFRFAFLTGSKLCPAARTTK
jgi:hypothetical protein